jgi:DnaK suppressor protein
MFTGAARRPRTAAGSLVALGPGYSFPSSPCAAIVPGGRAASCIPYPGRWRPEPAGASFPQTSIMAARTPLTKTEIKELKSQLQSERADLLAQYQELEESSFGSNQSDLTGEMAFDEEYADAGTATFERERDLSLVNNVRDLMGRIDKALAKIEDGTYGLCERCGKPIEKLRLKALPYANLCIKDKQAEERVR